MRLGVPRLMSSQQGQVVVMFALLIPVLFGLGSIVISVGNWYVHKRHLQTQVDAAAFAGAQAFTGCFLQGQLPQANANITAAALNYAGDTRRDVATRNLEVQTPDDVYVAINSTSYWQTSSGTDPNLPSSGYGLDYTDHVDAKGNATSDGLPCTTRKLDVKATDDKAPNLFRWIPLTPSPKARAQVAVWKEAGESGFLPWAIPEARPRRVAALWVDEALNATQNPTWTWLDGPTTNGQPDPNKTEPHNGEQVAVWTGVAGIPPNPTAPIADQTGMIVLQTRRNLIDDDLTGKSLTQICAMTNVTCLGSVKNVGTTAQSGIGFIHGKPQADGNPGVTLGDAELSNVPWAGGPAGNPCTDDSAPYFHWGDTDCDVRFRAQLDFDGALPANPREVRVNTSAFGNNCNGGVLLKKETEALGAIWWEQETSWFTIAAESGRTRVLPLLVRRKRTAKASGQLWSACHPDGLCSEHRHPEAEHRVLGADRLRIDHPNSLIGEALAVRTGDDRPPTAASAIRSQRTTNLSPSRGYRQPEPDAGLRSSEPRPDR